MSGALLYLGVFMVTFLLGIPVALGLGGTSIILTLLERGVEGFSASFLAQRATYGLNNFLLVAVPLFLYCGKVMNTGTITEKIFTFAESLVGWTRGGLGHVNVVASVIFAGMTGTATSDAAGLGAVELAAMKGDGYSDDFSVAVTGASSTPWPHHSAQPSSCYIRHDDGNLHRRITGGRHHSRSAHGHCDDGLCRVLCDPFWNEAAR